MKVPTDVFNIKLLVNKQTLAWNNIGQNFIVSVLPYEKTYILNETGQEIFKPILHTEKTIGELFILLKEKYKISDDELLEDILSFIYSLSKRKVLSPKSDEDLKMIEKFGKEMPINPLHSTDEFLPKLSNSQLGFFPIDVHWDITYKCNLNCIHCYLGDLRMKKNDELQYSECIKILEELRSLGTFNITFSGGEPFLKPEFITIVKEARKMGFKINIITNGTLLNNEMIDELKNLFIEINVSLYGLSSDFHEKVTGVKGSYKKTWNAIENLLESKTKFKLKVTAIKQNLNNMNKLINHLEKMGINFELNTSLLPDISESSDIIESCQIPKSTLEEELKDYIRKNINLLKKETWNPVCYAGRQRLVIDPEGNIYPCILLRWNCGNAKEQKIQEIWYNSIPMIFLRMLTKEQFRHCDNCDIKDFCVFCMGRNFLKTKNIFSPADDICLYAKTLKEIYKKETQEGELLKFNKERR